MAAGLFVVALPFSAILGAVERDALATDPIVQIGRMHSEIIPVEQKPVWSLRDLEETARTEVLTESRPAAPALRPDEQAAVQWSSTAGVVLINPADATVHRREESRNPWMAETSLDPKPSPEVFIVNGLIEVEGGDPVAIVNGSVVAPGDPIAGWNYLGSCPEGIILKRGRTLIGLRGLGKVTVSEL